MRRLLPVCVSLALVGCAEIRQLPPTPPDPQTQMPALANRIARLVEDERLKLDPGARVLTMDPELAKIALERARDMAAKNYLAHVSPDGDTSASLLMAEDATWQGLLGENLAAQHYLKASGVDVDIFAERFLDEWVKSDPHRENLAYPAYERTGVGAAVNGDTVYVVELFASDLGGKSREFDSPGTSDSAAGEGSSPDTQPPVHPSATPAGQP